MTANGVLTLGEASDLHYVRLGMEWESLANRENILTYESVNGVSTPHLHGSTPIFGRKRLDLSAEYEWTTTRMDWRVGINHTDLNRESTLMYPQTRGQRLQWTMVWSTWLYRFGAWELTLAADFRRGGFSEREELGESPARPGEYPMQLTDFYNCENEYWTMPRVGAGAGVRRNIRRFYIDLSARYEHGFDVHYVSQPNRVRATLDVGYNF